MKILPSIFAKCIGTGLLLVLYSAAFAAEPAGHIKSVTAITEVFGDGQKITAAAVEFDSDLPAAGISKSAFSVEGRTITNVYANNCAAKTSQSINGKYAIIELSSSDKNASILIRQGRSLSRLPVRISVTQLENITTVSEKTFVPDSHPAISDKTINLIVDDFRQFEFKDPETGKTLKYNLFIPKNYDTKKSYPLVTFIHDAGVTSDITDTTLIQGLGAVVWASPAEQAKHECFVLAPQYSTQIVNDNSEASEYLDVTVNLINSLTTQYSIDTGRLYATGQSGGCMMSIAINIKYPDLFAASFLVAGQWDAAKVSPLAKDKLWMIASAGDLKAYPGMMGITAALARKGARVSRATWSGQSSAAEFSSAVSKIISDGSDIKFTVLKKGTVVPAGMTDDGGSNHICTWRIAYTIEGIRDWLFKQKK